MVTKYSFQGVNKKNLVRVNGRNLPVSRKTTREICKFIKGKDVDRTINYLERVIKKQSSIPFVRHKRDIAHRPGRISSGGYPYKGSKQIINLLKSLKASAEDKGLNSESLKILHAAVNPGPVLMHYGRYRGKRRKMCNIEIIAQETETKPKSKRKKSKKKKSSKKDKEAKKSKDKSKSKKIKEESKTDAKKTESKESKSNNKADKSEAKETHAKTDKKEVKKKND